MLPLISKNERFKADCQKYKHFIDSTDNIQLKIEVTTLLNQLMAEARQIDSFYQSLSSGAGIASRVEDTRNKLSSIRKDLEKRCASLKP
jgi:hypothetical protein